MSTQQITPRSVVVGVDGSPPSDIALRWAADQARRTRVPLHILHALEIEVVLSDAYPLGTKEAPIDSDPVLAAAINLVRTTAPGLEAAAHSITGFPLTALVAASRMAGMVVVGSHGRGAIPSVLLGSVTQQLAMHAHCPVVVMRENTTADGVGSGQVVVGVDGTEASGPALRFAFAHADSTGSGLTAVHTWFWEPLAGLNLGEGVILDPGWSGDWTQIADQERTLVSQALAGLSQEYPDVPVLRHVVRGDPVVELLVQSQSASLLVLGSRGRGGFIGLLLGSVSRRLLKRAACPVAIVRSFEPSHQAS